MPHSWIRALLPCLLLTLAAINCASAATADPQGEKVDAIFARWNKPDSPGCVCAVIRDGKIVHVRGYGMEDLEHDGALSSKSVFYLASTSKQFTAASIALLVLDGKLSLDDDIRRHLPEMAEMATPITVRHLVHHTSGLRDYFNLLNLTGWTDTDYFNNDMVVKLLARQRTLNFAPGSRNLYSNSNYILLAEIVKRVSGRSLRQFAEERIFQPLGMTHTHFDDDYRQIVPHRVLSYLPKPGGGWYQLLKEFDAHGDGNLLSTVEDLARWDENFTSGKVGGAPLLKLIQTQGTLNSGKEIDYAFGLMRGTYRGLATVRHGGAFKGFRTEMIRFPEQKFTVIVLGNVGNLNAGQLAQTVAEVYLAGEFKTPPRAPNASAAPVANKREPVKIDPKLAEAYVGEFDFVERPGFILKVIHEDGRYFAQATNQGRLEIFPSSENTFFYTAIPAQITFHRGSDGTPVQRLTMHQGGDHEAARVQPYSVTPAELAAYAGRYSSEEIGTSFNLAIENDRLVAQHARAPKLTLTPTARDWFASPGSTIEFLRNERAEITALTATFGRAENIRFERDKRER